MIERELKIGALFLTLVLDDEERLLEVKLPTQIPEQLDRAALRELISTLAKYPLAPDPGADFTRTVRQRMRQIPWGTAMTYREIAEELGNPKAMRAVGQACASNRLLIVIPCHRVVAQSGLGGFAMGLEWKQKLLELESE